MGEVVSRVFWIALTCAVIAYGAYLFFGSIVSAETKRPMKGVDVYHLIDRDKHTHRLSGILMVPTACHSISVKTEERAVGDYHLSFSTFGDVHGCAEEAHPRAFRVVLSAPLVGNVFTASLNGEPLVFRIVSSHYMRAE